MKWTAFGTQNIEESKLEALFLTAKKTGGLYVTKEALFFKSIGKLYYVKMEELAWVYMRIEDSNTMMCCSRANFTNYYIVIYTKQRKKKMFPFEKKEPVEKLIQFISQSNPHVMTKFSKEIEAAFLETV